MTLLLLVPDHEGIEHTKELCRERFGKEITDEEADDVLDRVGRLLWLLSDTAGRRETPRPSQGARTPGAAIRRTERRGRQTGLPAERPSGLNPVQVHSPYPDAKQHFGLEDFMGVREMSVSNGIGVSFFLVNLTTYLLGDFRKAAPGAGIADLKSFYRGRHYLEMLLKMLPDRPEGITCERLLEQVCRLGCIHERSEEAAKRKMAA